MAVTKIRKISSWTLLISSIISIIVLGMFYAGGVVDPAAEMKEPIYTGLLINWTSVLFFVTIISTMLFAVWQFLTLLKTNAKSAIMSLVVLVCFVAVLFITYTMGDATPLRRLSSLQHSGLVKDHRYVDHVYNRTFGSDRSMCSLGFCKENHG